MMKRLLLTISLLTLSGLPTTALAGDWLTGPALSRYLSEPIDLVWPENPLAQSLAHLSDVHKVAILLDRRIDPDQKISLTLKQSPLGQSLVAIAMRSDLGTTVAGPVAYFGPPASAAKLRTLVFLREEEAKKLPPAVKKKFLQAKPLAWDDFSQPRALLEKLGEENQLEISGLDAVPYDLWASADLPPMTLVERLSLIAVQYDLTIEFAADGKKVSLAPIPPDVRVAKNYPAGKKPEEAANRFSELAPSAEIKISGEKLVVKATLEDHERLAAPHSPGGQTAASNAPPDLSRQQFTLTINEQPIGPLLKLLAKQIGLELQMDEKTLENAGVHLSQRVSFEVKDATIDQLLQAAIHSTPLKYRLQNRILVIEAMEK